MFIFDGTKINLLIAFAAGLLTFFASCLMPLVPAYLAYLSGFIKHPKQDPKQLKREMVINSVIFTLGFIMVFVLLGLTANSLGLLLRQNREVVQQAGGIFMILVGLFMLGLFESKFFYQEKRLNINYTIIKFRKLKSFIFGVVFGFAWTPCIGPVLGVILFWASQLQTMYKGMLLLLAYGLGLGVPFIITAIFYEKLVGRIKYGQKLGRIINVIAGLLILVTGVLLLAGRLSYYTLFLSGLINVDPLSF